MVLSEGPDQLQNINEVVQVLKKSGVGFTEEVKEVHPGSFHVSFKDPSGNTLSLYENTAEAV